MMVRWLFLLLIAVLHGQPQWPRFEQYPAPKAFTGKPAPPILKTPGEEAIDTEIREGAAKGPNFAGHYTIVKWGCGSACVSIAVADAMTGIIGESPFSILGYATSLRFPDDTTTHTTDFEPVAYRLNSRLLIVRGCPEDKSCGAYYYEWTGSRFKLLRSAVVNGK
jgi:hypothetical protein